MQRSALPAAIPGEIHDRGDYRLESPWTRTSIIGSRSARAGDREAFCELVRRYQGPLRGLVALSVTDRHDVLEIVQDAFVDAWRGLSTFDLGRPFGPWLRTICRNRVARHFRDRARQHPALALVDEALAQPAGEVADAPGHGEERLAALRCCLEQLGEDQRRLLQLRFDQGWAVKRIAEDWGRQANAISMMLYRLKADLMACAERRVQAARS